MYKIISKIWNVHDGAINECVKLQLSICHIIHIDIRPSLTIHRSVQRSNKKKK